MRIVHNVPGRFYVDDRCIECMECVRTVPQVFAEFPTDRRTYVYRQPVSDEEISMVERAMFDCPVMAVLDEECKNEEFLEWLRKYEEPISGNR